MNRGSNANGITVDRESRTYELKNPDDVSAEFLGVVFGGKVTKVQKYGNVTMIRYSGHMRWCGLGDQVYEPPKWLLGRVVDGKFIHNYTVYYDRETQGAVKAVLDELVVKLGS